MPNLRHLISPQIPQLGACGTSLGMTSKKDASLGMSVGTFRLAKNGIGRHICPPLQEDHLNQICGGGDYPRPSDIYPVFFGVKAQDVE